MVSFTSSELQLVIYDGAPQEKRTYIVKALTAAIRWNACATEKYEKDDDNLYVLAQLLESFVTDKATE